MATAAATRPPTNGTNRSSSSVGQRPSLSSFPSRTPSNQSLQNGAGRLPQRKRQQNGSQSSAQTSQSQLSNHGLVPPRNVRRLRSQYPADSPERHVEYILVAAFDIDKGCVMEHQYPGPISGDEGMLAELMLPDQAHARSEDWTIFFLHKDTSEEEEAREERRAARRARREERAARQTAIDNGEEVAAEEIEEDSLDESEEEDEGGEGPPLIYVLNLVNTKHDSSVKRQVLSS